MAVFLNVDAANLHLDTDREIVETLGAIGPNTEQALVKTEARLAEELVARTRAKASGDVLQIRTGRFIASIHTETDVEGHIGLGRTILASFSRIAAARADSPDQGVFTTVSIDDPKAHILEYGATLPAHDIDPNTAHALRFLGREGIKFAAHVHWPGAELPPHPTLHAAFAEMQIEILTDLEQAVGTL